MSNLVAVYGTLKTGEGNHIVMERSGGKSLGKGETVENFTMYGGWGFPRVVFDGSTCPIQVEIFEIQNFEPLDSLEGHPNFVERKQVQVLSGESVVEPLTCWMYFHPPIPSDQQTDVVEDGLWQRSTLR